MSHEHPQSSRREFLGATTAAAVGSVLAAPLVQRAGAADGISRALRIGLVGCGNRGSGAAMEALKADPHVELQDGAAKWDMVAREVTGDERAEWWDRGVAAYPDYAAYQSWTDRLIPVFVLERE